MSNLDEFGPIISVSFLPWSWPWLFMVSFSAVGRKNFSKFVTKNFSQVHCHGVLGVGNGCFLRVVWKDLL